jgi:hypothetical protein
METIKSIFLLIFCEMLVFSMYISYVTFCVVKYYYNGYKNIDIEMDTISESDFFSFFSAFIAIVFFVILICIPFIWTKNTIIYIFFFVFFLIITLKDINIIKKQLGNIVKVDVIRGLPSVVFKSRLYTLLLSPYAIFWHLV